MGNGESKVYAEVALYAASAAGELLLESFESDFEVGYKGRIDLVTEMDKKSEDLVKSIISSHFPDHGILAEESGSDRPDSEYVWVVDPLDGTTNYAHGFGFFAVSIALMKKGQGPIAAAVYAPYLREMYSAEKGCGAALNGERISVSAEPELEKSLLATGFPYDPGGMKINLGHFGDMILLAQAVRRPGSAALDMCAVAAGKFDGFWEIGLHPWDTAAALLIAEEAGARVTDFSGGEYSIYSPEVLATNGRIHEKMMEVLNYGRK